MPESFIYYLQCRAVPFGDEAKLAQQRIEQRVTILSTVGIRFCPWCGRRLDDLAQAAPDLFTELAERHEGFVPDV